MTVRPATHDDALATWRESRADDDPLHDPAYFCALESAGVDLSTVGGPGLPMVVVRPFRTGPFRRAGVPPLTPFNPVLLDPSEDESAVHRGASSLHGLSAALDSEFDDVIVHIPPTVTDLRPLQWSGWSVQPRYTYRLDPRTAADPATWSASARRNARQHRPEFGIREDPNGAALVSELCHRSYVRHGRTPPLTPEAMAAACQSLVAAGLVRCFVASRHSGPPTAALALLQTPSIAYYWMAGSEPGPAMTVLLAHVLERLADEGVGRFDFVGANTPGIAEFKRRFNPRMETYHAARHTSSRAFRVLRAMRSVGVYRT